MIIYDSVQQGSPEWHRLRAGKFTASTIPSLFMGESTKGYQDIIKRIARERLTGNPVESFKSDWMNRGNELEAKAIKQYSEDHFFAVSIVGFVEVDDWCGCSPDGLVGSRGMMQVKCPKWNTFHDYKTIKDIDRAYIIQCQAEILFCERDWNDLYIYDPELEPKEFQIERDQNLQGDIIKKIEVAKIKVIEEMKSIRVRNSA